MSSFCISGDFFNIPLAILLSKTQGTPIAAHTESKKKKISIYHSFSGLENMSILYVLWTLFAHML